MIELLQNKNSSTRFQILVEIAASGPAVRQRAIAARLGITPQAVSEYVGRLVEDEMVISTGRSSYRVSIKGVNWVLQMLRELNDYVSLVTRAVTNLTVCAAIADTDVLKGQAVGLKMENGILVASPHWRGGATGIAMSSARKGQDLDVSNIEGLVEIARGKIEILQIPSIAKGGSRSTGLTELKTRISGDRPLGAIGIEALAAIRQVGIEPQYIYGVTEAAVEAVRCGLTFIVVCTDDAVSDLIKRLQEDGVEYDITDLTLKTP